MWVEICRRILALFFIGIVIKLLDNEVDGDHRNEYTIGILNEIEQYKFPYGLIILTFAMLLDKEYSFGLFSSAYMVGMFNFVNRKLPLKIKSYQEIIILIIINLISISHKVFIHSFVIIILIQMLDDLLDIKYDAIYGYFNFANKYGIGEVSIVSVILITASIMISSVNTFLILSTWFFINYLYSRG